MNTSILIRKFRISRNMGLILLGAAFAVPSKGELERGPDSSGTHLPGGMPAIEDMTGIPDAGINRFAGFDVDELVKDYLNRRNQAARVRAGHAELLRPEIANPRSTQNRDIRAELMKSRAGRLDRERPQNNEEKPSRVAPVDSNAPQFRDPES